MRGLGLGIGVIGVGVMGIGVMGGCVPRSSRLPETAGLSGPSPVSGSVVADWDDVEAAVMVGVPRCDTAVERRRRVLDPAVVVDAGATVPPMYAADDYVRYEYDVVTIRGLSGLLVVERGVPATGEGPIPINLMCRIGPSGSPEFEACVVDSVSRRLVQLRGVRWAPVSWEE